MVNKERSGKKEGGVGRENRIYEDVSRIYEDLEGKLWIWEEVGRTEDK